MNNQTLGPLVPHPYPNSSHLAGKGGFTVAATYDLRHDKDGSEEEANRTLLAAAYTAFDKAGRELGIDAIELAKTINITKLLMMIDIARSNADARADMGPLDVDMVRLLAKLPNPN